MGKQVKKRASTTKATQTRTAKKKTQKKIKGDWQFSIGVTILILTFFVKWLFIGIGEQLCDKNAGGTCDVASTILIGNFWVIFMTVWVGLGLILTVYGILKLVETIK